MHRTLSWLVTISMLGPAASSVDEPATVFVDARTGDNRTGDGSQRRPWQSIQFAVSRMKSGDTCILREGVYRESVIPHDGQSFRAYENEDVLISGCDVIANWKPHQGTVWRAASAPAVLQVFLGGNRLPKARYPDDDGDMHTTADWAETVATRGRPAKDGSAEVTFTAGLGGKSFDGGFFTGLNGHNPFQANMGRIVRTDGDTLHCDQTNLRWYKSRPGEFDGEGRGYIIDHIDALTAENEWHWEHGQLYWIPPKNTLPEEHVVEGRTRLYGFDCSKCKKVSIEGLNFKAASVLLDGSTQCVIDGCRFTDVSPFGRYFDRHTGGDPEHYRHGSPEDGTAGIYMSGERNVIQNCRVSNGWGALISVRGKGNTVENNVVEDANWQCREFAVNIVVNGANHRVVKNTVRTSTAMLIVMIDIDRIPTTAPLIKLNDCRDYGHIMLDGGTAAIYMNGNNDLQNADISYNLIADNRTKNQRVSSGIYLDDGANNFRVHHNVIVGNGQTRCGLFTHRGNQRMNVFNNTFWGQQQAGWVSAVWEGSRDKETMIFRNNLSSGEGFSSMGVKDPITQDHNRDHVPAEEFVHVEAMNFAISDPASESVDAGVIIPNAPAVDDGKPDLGAYHRGAHWKAGVDWK